MSKQKTNKSKEQNTNTPAGVLTVGLDIGYGVVKVVTDQNSFGFPSVMGHAREIKFQPKHNSTCDRLLNVIWGSHLFAVDVLPYINARFTKNAKATV